VLRHWWQVGGAAWGGAEGFGAGGGKRWVAAFALKCHNIGRAANIFHVIYICG